MYLFNLLQNQFTLCNRICFFFQRIIVGILPESHHSSFKALSGDYCLWLFFFSFSDYFRPDHCLIMQWKLCTMWKLVKTCLEEGSISYRPRLRGGIQSSRCIISHIWWLNSSKPWQALTEKKARHWTKSE